MIQRPMPAVPLDESFMYRTLEGSIKGWNHAAVRFYGFPSQAAVGCISHSLLKTEFPEPLDRINRHLGEASYWKGRLLHTTRDGRKVEVESQWMMVKSTPSKPARVIEINRDPHGENPPAPGGSLVSLLMGMPSMLQELQALA